MGTVKDRSLRWAVLKDRKTVVPSKFTYVEDLPGGAEATLRIEVVEGEGAVCRNVEVDAPDGSITWETLREVPVHSLIRQALRAAVIPIHYSGQLGPEGAHRFSPGLDGDPLGSLDHVSGRGRPRQSQSREHLEKVARIYKAAVKDGMKAPVEEVAKQMLGSPWKAPTAKRWVSNARKAGLLPATTRGKKAA